jgi:hypothetical protein
LTRHDFTTYSSSPKFCNIITSTWILKSSRQPRHDSRIWTHSVSYCCLRGAFLGIVIAAQPHRGANAHHVLESDVLGIRFVPSCIRPGIAASSRIATGRKRSRVATGQRRRRRTAGASRRALGCGVALEGGGGRVFFA